MATEREWAERFHDLYEKLAPEHGYVTRQQSRVFDTSTPNAQLMMAVVRGLGLPDLEAKAARCEELEHECARRLEELNQVQSQSWMGADKLVRERDALAARIEAAVAYCGKCSDVQSVDVAGDATRFVARTVLRILRGEDDDLAEHMLQTLRGENEGGGA